MPTPVYKLTNDQIKEKVQRLSYKLLHNKTITKYEYEILLNMLGRFDWAWGERDSTNSWATRAFDEVERLTKLIQERWEAGWTGNKE